MVPLPPCDDIPVVISIPDHSALQKFAIIFDQDYDIVGDGVLEDTQIYYNNLSETEKAELLSRYIVFMTRIPGKSDRSILEEWFKTGAQFWPKSMDIRKGLSDILLILEGKKVIPVEKNKKIWSF